MDQLEIASRKRRILAFFIDFMLLMLFGTIGCFLLFGKNWDVDDSNQIITRVKPFFIVIFLAMFFRDSFGGMSFGRYILGISVRNIKDTSKIPNVFLLALRNVFVCIWPIEFIALVFSKKKLRIGDYIAQSSVIRRNDITPKKRLLSFIVVTLVASTLIYLSMSTIIKQTSAYRCAITSIENSAEVSEKVGKIIKYGSLPMGSLQIENSKGFSQINIKVKGEKGRISTVVTMEKNPGTDWQLKGIVLKN